MRVTFQHSAPRRFDLVIGADGLHSRVRRLAFGPESRYRRYLGGYIAVYTVPNFLGLDGRILSYGALDRTVVMLPRLAGRRRSGTPSCEPGPSARRC